METKKTLEHKIDSTLSAMDDMQTVNVSPFFKDKTMNVLFAEKQVEQKVWAWFTPKLQLATLVCVVLLNVFAFTKLKTNTYENNINEFAETYGLSSDSEESLLNFY
jgi:quinol-cytochrome oxidoreductase complex cytochrome b subunit